MTGPTIFDRLPGAMKMMNINPIESESPLTARSGAPVMVIADSDFLLEGYQMGRLCECGCGEPTNYRCGKSNRFISGHNGRLQPRGEFAYVHNRAPLIREMHPLWKGGISNDGHGRILIKDRNHHRANNYGYVYEHVILAEKALGKRLLNLHPIHHFDGNPSNNFRNLIVCENTNYHRLLHQRKRAFEVCGHTSWRKCSICKRYDIPDALYIYATTCYHRKCKSIKQKLEAL